MLLKHISYHRTVYRFLRKNEQSAPVLSALPILLQLAKDDIRLLRRFFDRGELSTYDRVKTQRPSKRLKKGTYYDQSDSRAPDNNEALFGDDEERKRKQTKKNLKALPIEPPVTFIEPTEENQAQLCIYEKDVNTEEECPALKPEDPKVQNVVEDLGYPAEAIPKEMEELVEIMTLQGMWWVKLTHISVLK